MQTLFRPACSTSMGCSAERGRQRRCFSSPLCPLPVKTAQKKRCVSLIRSMVPLFSLFPPEFVAFDGTKNAALSWNLWSKSRRNVDESELRIQYGGLRDQPSVKTVRFGVYWATWTVFTPLKKLHRLYCAVISHTRVVFLFLFFHTQMQVRVLL